MVVRRASPKRSFVDQNGELSLRFGPVLSPKFDPFDKAADRLTFLRYWSFLKPQRRCIWFNCRWQLQRGPGQSFVVIKTI